METKRKLLLASIVWSLMAGGQASAQELVYGSWLPAGEYVNRVALPKVFDTIAKETNGAVKWKLVPGGQLADPKTTFQAVHDGLMAAGIGIPSYVPSVVPAAFTIYSTIAFGDDNVATSAAALETLTLNCPSCIAEMKKLNAVPLSGWVAGPYYLACRSPVQSLGDLKGKRVRGVGGYNELLNMFGAVPVGATLVEAVGLLQRGGLDCQLGTHGWLKVFGYGDVVKAITDQPLGMTGPAIGLLLNRDVWNKFTPEQKQIHMRAAARLSALQSLGQFVIEEEQVLNELMKTKGITMAKAARKDFDAVTGKYEAIQRKQNIENSTKLGVKDPAAIIDAYAAARKKWGALSKGIGRDVDKLTAAIQREIYDKVAPEKL
ncbi:MAG: C4-dicarboxylate ABC transporter substrate-binding protein [Betaproteobacteria bacterium]|nr:MAG: C4-dicarboxylate ABC transporter substrate-binding protein [Betaproteobacteria bacterium]